MKFFLVVLSAWWISISIAYAQCPAGSEDTNVELVTNGDFEQGNFGFSSGYSYTDAQGDLWIEGKYGVGTDAEFYNGGFTDQASDHTSGSGNYLIVNGAPTPGVQVWCQTIDIQPNTVYLFSAWVTSVTASNPAALQFSINGTTIGSVFSAPGFTFFGEVWPGWVQFFATWESGVNDSTATICILNQETTLGGNDFGIDDISFQPCTCTFQTQPLTSTNVCAGEPVSLNAAAGADSYAWSPAESLNQSTGQNVIATTDTTTTYTLVATLNFCSDTVTAVVTVDPSPVVSAGNDTSVCANQPVQLQGSGGTSYQWSPAIGLSSSTSQNPTATVSQTTSYVLTVANEQGCPGKDTVVINILNPNGLVVSNDTAICLGETITLSASGAASYQWSPSSQVGCDTCASNTITPTDNVTFTITSNTNGCIESDDVLVTVWPLPNVSAGNDVTTCANESVDLNGSGGTSYQWSPATGLNSSTSSTPTATLDQNTTYTLVAQDANGCTGTDQVLVNVNSLPTATIGPNVSACPGDTVVLSADGGTSYEWSPNTGLNATTGNFVTATVNGNITYTVVVTDDNGCTDDAQVLVSALAPQPLVVTPDTLICFGELLTLTATGGVHYNWSGPDGNCDDCFELVIASPKTSGTYNVVAIDSNGCETSDDVQVFVNSDCAQFIFPTGFTPNGDGVNDLFRPVTKSMSQYNYYVYNRWGQVVFTGTKNDEGWNGVFNGDEQPVGAYSWYAEGTTLSGTELILQGSVLLIR